MKDKSFSKKVVIIGIDALAPDLFERFIAEKKLPNFEKIVKDGGFRRMETTNPPQSPVAWASFATGMNPGGTGIFDFISRDPENYLPRLNFSGFKTETKYIKFGNISIPFSKIGLVNQRKGTPFWVFASRANIPSTIIHCPGTFPPDKINDRMLSGMGVPDIRGTQGTFTFYTTKAGFSQDVPGGKIIKIEKEGDIITTSLPGPVDISSEKIRETVLPFKIKIDDPDKKIGILISNEKIDLKEKEWSSWVPLKFNLGVFKKVKGICRFYLKSVSAEVELYCTPVNFDPMNPVFPVSCPGKYSRKLAEKIGYFSTLGIPDDTKALNENVITEDVYLQMADHNFRKEREIFWLEFNRFKGGILFSYFGVIDTVQHMFWRYTDRNHFAAGQKELPGYENIIEEYYMKMDDFIGELYAKLGREAILLVVSDHGAGPFYRACNINSWLLENGLLKLKDNGREGSELFQNVDWAKTKAYSVGFNSIFINQKGREAQGIVQPGTEAEELKKNIKSKLTRWKDPGNGEFIMKNVYLKEEVFHGAYINEAPDIVCGYRKGYRASWQTALGAAPENALEDNKRKWSGDHLFDSSEVPACLISNKKIKKERPSIIDIAPTVLKIFNIRPSADIDGENIFE